MSVDYHFYTSAPNPIGVEELAKKALAAGEHLFVLRNHHDWRDYEVATDGVLQGDVVVCMVSAKAPDCAELIRAIREKDEAAIIAALQTYRLGACDLSISEGPGWADDEEAEELAEVYGEEYVSHRDAAAFHFEAVGSAVAGAMIEDLFELIAGLRPGMYEDPQEGTFTISGGTPK